MYYFDNKYLAQYLDQNIKVSVFANNEWMNLTDISDVSDARYGVGYDEFGGDSRFDYREIEQIKVGNNIITLDTLQTQKTGKEPPKADKPEGSDDGDEDNLGDFGGDDLGGGEDSEEPTKDKKEPDLSWYSPMYDIGRHLIIESKRRKKR